MKKNIKEENYLERKPICKNGLNWSKDENGNVTLEMENKGVANKIMQKLIKKPKISYIHLDEMGSFIWPLMDGEKDILEIGKFVEEHFGEKANPLYERLSQYFKTLEKYNFIEYK
ncbi:MAG: PqqD family protein [Acutalibacteraceae bacterium]|nr:PqqD family protein [Acutalibacteraceae bacterium]